MFKENIIKDLTRVDRDKPGIQIWNMVGYPILLPSLSTVSWDTFLFYLIMVMVDYSVFFPLLSTLTLNTT